MPLNLPAKRVTFFQWFQMLYVPEPLLVGIAMVVLFFMFFIFFIFFTLVLSIGVLLLMITRIRDCDIDTLILVL